MADKRRGSRGAPKGSAPSQRPRASATAQRPPVQRPVTEIAEFRALVTERTSFAWMLSIAMVVVYFAFILLVAFDGGLMATPIGGGPITLGIVLGVAIIVFAFALTGVYVARANSRFDELTARIREGR